MLEQSTVGGFVGYGSLSPSDFTGDLQYFVFGRWNCSSNQEILKKDQISFSAGVSSIKLRTAKC
jgi:hypothetical protein